MNTIRYILTKEELRELYYGRIQHTSAPFSPILIWFTGAFLCALLSITRQQLFVSALFFIFLLFLMPIKQSIYLKKCLKDFSGETELLLEDRWIVERSKEGKFMKHYHSCIDEIKETDFFLEIYYQVNHLMYQKMLIPKSAFQTLEEQESFFDWIKEKAVQHSGDYSEDIYNEKISSNKSAIFSFCYYLDAEEALTVQAIGICYSARHKLPKSFSIDYSAIMEKSIGLYLIFSLTLSLILAHDTRHLTIYFFVVSIAAAFGFILFLFNFLRCSLNHQYTQLKRTYYNMGISPDGSGINHVFIGPDRITRYYRNAIIDINCHSLCAVTQEEKYLFLHSIDNANIPIPLSAFASEEELNQIQQYLEKFLSKNKI